MIKRRVSGWRKVSNNASGLLEKARIAMSSVVTFLEHPGHYDGHAMMKETTVGEWGMLLRFLPWLNVRLKKMFCEKVGEPPTDGASALPKRR